MKNKTKFLAILVLFLNVFAQAAESRSSSNSESGSNHLGLGVASINLGALGASTAVTGWIPIKSTAMGIQPYFSILGTTGSFNFLAGGAFKATVAGAGSVGLHLGGDVLLGSIATRFIATFGGIFGIHYALHPSLMLHVDGGPQVSIDDGDANFTMQAVSSLLGASLIYLF